MSSGSWQWLGGVVIGLGAGTGWSVGRLVVWVLTMCLHHSCRLAPRIHPASSLLAAAVGGCWLAWASGCRLRGCCIGIPLSWHVHWAPVLAFHCSSSVVSWSSVCPVPLAPLFRHSRPCCLVVLSTRVGSKAPTEYRGFSKELTERAWLQLVRSCALHTHCCPNFWKVRVTGCGCSEEYCEDKNGAPRSSKTKRCKEEWE